MCEEHTNTFPIHISPIIEGAAAILITFTIPSLNIDNIYI